VLESPEATAGDALTPNPTTECNSPNGCDEVYLEVPGKIQCRNVVMRTVSAACMLTSATKHGEDSDFGVHVISAVGEAYNNIVFHGYAGRKPGSIQVKIRNCSKGVRIEIRDTGASFDPAKAPPPDLDALPESGVGIFLMRSMVDEVSYVAGCPNVLTLVKRLHESCGTD
jgi:serine/threonine-protein kinase RsbW